VYLSFLKIGEEAECAETVGKECPSEL